MEWAADAAADPLPFPVVPAPRPLVVDTDRELTIVDTPPGTAQVIQEAIDVADLVIVPTGVSPLDVRRVWPTLEITAHRPTAVLLTGVDLRTRLAEEVRALLEGEGCRWSALRFSGARTCAAPMAPPRTDCTATTMF